MSMKTNDQNTATKPRAIGIAHPASPGVFAARLEGETMRHLKVNEWCMDGGRILIRQNGADEYFIAVATCSVADLRELAEAIDDALNDAAALERGE
uniref:Uncharacterized protein n=1 Tax=viral metagenome TaxID=1070528 RepID=A0A6M3LET4_9ZZZZ